MSLDDMEGALLPLLLAKATTSGLPPVIFLVSTTHKSSGRLFFAWEASQGDTAGHRLRETARDGHTAPVL